MGIRVRSIDWLLGQPAVTAWIETHGRGPVVAALRAAADDVRARTREEGAEPLSQDALDRAVLDAAAARLSAREAGTLRRVINATGVLIHTNLGRAPVSPAALARIGTIAAGYASVEYDLETGTRGRRDIHAEALIRELTTATAAIVVNNNAAATLLVLTALAAGREVIVSRGELVEIGGGFRVPDVMAQSGAVLREVGTTNRTRAADYAAAITERTALILRVHPSNFRIEGFTARPELTELAEVAKTFSVPLFEDLGSGLLAHSDLLPDEPAARESLAAGASLVSFSGDKLLGGPQAGIIAGDTALVERIRRHPLMRALRVDKITYAALEATLSAHAAGRAAQELPLWRMLTLTVEEIDARARALAAAVPSHVDAQVIDGESTIGGGSAPGVTMPTRLVAITCASMTATELEEKLRSAATPVIARVQDDRVLLDMRTVAPAEDSELARILSSEL